MLNVFFKTRPIHELQPFKFEMWISMSIQKKGGDTKEVKGLGPVSFLFIFFFSRNFNFYSAEMHFPQVGRLPLYF